MSEVRTRFAPSPTGYVHVGNIRAALFTWILAKQKSGKFILRIEDTDQQRYVDGATDLIFETLKWLGLQWNEGPDIGGKYGPYVQSERKDIYLDWANKLIKQGLAYSDPYTAKEVEKFRNEAKQQKIAFLYRNYRPESTKKWDGTVPLRFKVVNPKRYKWNDPILGSLSAGPEALDDFILIKSDGMPTYNFAHVIDDTEMKITHVIRGLEYVPSIPKYLSLYEALNIKAPTFICTPHIMAPGGKKKLGKRDGAKSVVEYRDQGILPEAMFNYLATLGWNDGTEQEIYSQQEIVEKFSFDRVQKSGANFDEQKLLWMNGQWIRKFSLDDLYNRCENYWPKSSYVFDKDYKKRVLTLIQDRIKQLSDISALSSFFFEEPVPKISLIFDNKNLNKIDKEKLKSLLTKTKDNLKNVNFDSVNNISDCLNNLLITTNQKPGILFSLIRIVTTWTPFSPSLPESLSIIGKDNTLARIDKALQILS